MATTSKLPEGFYMFEQPFLRAPYESVRRQFRATQKHVERDMTALKNSSKELSKKPNTTSQDAIKALDAMIAKVDSLNKKLVETHENGTAPNVATMLSRLRHLEELDKLEEDELEGWTNVRLDRWLADWSLRNGFLRTAENIAKERHIEELIDSPLFMEIFRIEDALQRKSCTEALAWCSDNKNALRKNKCTLEFELRLQEYIELARAAKHPEALAYWRKHLQPWHETHLTRIQQASALIAFKPDTKCKSYRKLYDDKRWQFLVQSFRRAIYELHSLPTDPLLHYALYAGLTSLKVSACYDEHSHNPDCPICDESCLGTLAEEVPFSHHANSTIVCRITGKIMNEDNPPMAFPNGYVYSAEALREMAKKNNGMVKCPRTQLEVPFDQLRKVFIS